MKPQALAAHPVAVHRRRRSAPARLLDRVVHRYLALPIGVAIGLVWANTAPEPYFIVAHSLAFPVNEIGMALFVGLIMQEIVEAVMPGGARLMLDSEEIILSFLPEWKRTDGNQVSLAFEQDRKSVV